MSKPTNAMRKVLKFFENYAAASLWQLPRSTWRGCLFIEAIIAKPKPCSKRV